MAWKPILRRYNVSEWPIPTCTEEIKHFLGLATYYRKFVKELCSDCSPSLPPIREKEGVDVE